MTSHSRTKQRAALISLFASGGLGAAKLMVGIATGSLAVMSEALHSFMDFIATLITLMAVRAADRPADQGHPWGHAKFESVAAFAECGLLVGAAGWIGLEAVKRLTSGEAGVEVSAVAIGVLVASIVVDFWRSRALDHAAQETGSYALAADALHFTADMVSSGLALIGLLAVWLGYPAGDSMAALVVAGFILHATWRLGRRTFDVLVDAAPPGVTEKVADAAARVPGVLSIEQTRVRTAGSTLFADVRVTVDRALAQERVEAIRTEVVSAIAEAVPGLEATVSTSPITPDDETLVTRVHVLAMNHGLAVHHVTVQHIGTRISVSVDIEMDGRMPLGEAHALASRFEDEVEANLGAGVEVETHIEPLTVEPLLGQDAAEPLHSTIVKDLTQFAYELGDVVRDVHNVRVRETEAGLVVNFHARLDPGLSVRAAHEAVDAVERRLRRHYPSVARVVGHAEPRR